MNISPSHCRVAIVQHPPVFLDLAASLEKALTLADQAAGSGAQLILFPESWLPGYPVWLDESPGAALWDHPPARHLHQILADNSITIPGPESERLSRWATARRVYLVMGLHERSGGTLYNTTLTCTPEGAISLHRKLMPTYTERLVWGMGDGSTLGVVETPWGNLGGLICWEHWMPLVRAAMHARQESIHTAQWPTVRELHQIASRHYAFEGQCFVLAAGAVLTKSDVLDGFDGLGLGDSPARALLSAIPGDGGRLLQRGGQRDHRAGWGLHCRTAL